MTAVTNATIRMRFNRLPATTGLMVRAALPFGRGPLKGDATIPRIEADVAGVVISATALRRYRQVCGFAGNRVPATWLQVLAGPLHMAILAHKAFPLPAMGIVHTGNRIDQHAPVQIGDRVRILAYVDGHRPHKRGVEFDIRTEVERDGKLVWEATTTVLSMAGAGKGGKGGGKGERPAPPPAGEPENAARSVIWKVAEDQGRRYSAVSGDRNPIHLYAATAKLFGFKRAIVHGMWSLARALAELEDQLPERDLRIDVSFKRPVFLPSRVHFVSHLASQDDDATGHTFALRRPDSGKEHLVGEVVSPIPESNDA